MASEFGSSSQFRALEKIKEASQSAKLCDEIPEREADMRSQSSNPIFKSHGDLIGSSGLYPAEHVNIFWNEADGGGQISGLEIVFIPRGGHVPVTGEGLPLWERFAAYIARWNRDLGNACDGWLEPDGLTPAQIFGHLLRVGFASQDELVAALREFSGIEGDPFAADMLSAFIDEEEVD